MTTSIAMSPAWADAIAAKSAIEVVPDAALNLQARPDQLDHEITPKQHVFVRNNGTLPTIDDGIAANWRLVVDGTVAKPLSLSLEDLRSRFVQVTVAAVIECAGNGRSSFAPQAQGLQWGHGAVAQAQWTGVRISDLLAEAQADRHALCVAHESPDRDHADPTKAALSRALPIWKAQAPETLVAFAMNGEPLDLLHGFPLRIVAPGFPGSAWQKWLNRLWVRDVQHDGAKMTGLDYRLPRQPVMPGDVYDPEQFDVIEDIKVKAMITSPATGFWHLIGQPLAVEGFAWSGHTPVERVDLSTDGGATWLRAELSPAMGRFAWHRFRCRVMPVAGPLKLAVRATDKNGTPQPLHSAQWNPRGYLNNAVHVVSGIVV